MSEHEVEFLAGDFCQIESLFDFILEIIVRDRQPQTKLLDPRRVVFDDKFWFVEFVFFIHGCHSCFFACLLFAYQLFLPFGNQAYPARSSTAGPAAAPGHHSANGVAPFTTLLLWNLRPA
jgi:hypothetical protein